MVELHFRRADIRIDFSFFAVLAIVLTADSSGSGFLSFIACLCHEVGHLIVLFLQGNFPGVITFCGGGIRISGCKHETSVLALSAGCLVNFAIAGSIALFSQGTSIFTLLFLCANIIVGIYNLLPLKSLDGGQLLERAATKLMPPAKAHRICAFFHLSGFLLCIALFLLVLLSDILNISMFFVLIYIFFLDFLVKL